MEEKKLRPIRTEVKVKGKLYYSESFACWNSLRFRKEIVNEFPQLKEKISKFTYSMLLHHDYDELEKEISKIKRDKEAIPILLWMAKEKQID